MASRQYVEVGVYNVLKVKHHRIEKRDGRWMATFCCRWLGFSCKHDSYEPLNHLLDCPRLVKDYILKTAKSHAAFVKKNGMVQKGRIPPPANTACLKIFEKEKDLWYLPKGDEFVRRIVCCITVNQQDYLGVVFRHLNPAVVYVPLVLMEYYFPVETMLLYLKKDN